MGKAIFLLVTILLASCACAGNLLVPAPTCAPVFRLQADGEHLTAPDYATAVSPGNPALPFKDIRVIIPPGANPASLTVTLVDDTRETLALDTDVAPTPPIAISVDGKSVLPQWGRGKQIESGRNQLVYGKNALYPASNVQLTSVGKLRKWRIATIRYYPFRYDPTTRQLERTSGGQISISFSSSAAPSSATGTIDDDLFADRANALTANFSQAQGWYSTARPSGVSAVQSSEPTTGYMIITTSAIVAGSSKLQDFVSHKTNRGFTVEVATEAQWGGGAGDGAANNIRAYLQANYAVKHVKYVLLIGNPDPSVGSVPMKMLWPRYGEDTYREAPSDYFYADLTGNWDLNSNGYFGEESDFGPGGVDCLPEVIVGRIPFYGDFAALDSILQKTINYESGAFRGSWVRNVLVSMKPSDSTTPGYQLGEAIKTSAATPAGLTMVRAYDSDYGLSPRPEYIPCTSGNVLAAWRQHAGFHFWWTHGSETLASDVISTDGCQDLDDNYPSFVFECSCLNGSPEWSNNLAFALLKRGAISTSSASRVSWYYPGETVYTDTDSNAGMAYRYALKLMRDHLPCGDAHYDMLAELPDTIWMNHCVFNIYGDPSVAYPSAPVISHTPLANTDNTTDPYVVTAEISTTSPMAAGNPVLKWSTVGDHNFTSVPMGLIVGTSYSASIPAQPYGATVYYYIEAADTAGEHSSFPYNAPDTLLSFQVIQDAQPPVIIHKPLSDTGNKFGPYPIIATVMDDLGVASVTLHYNINSGQYRSLPMSHLDADDYEAFILGPTVAGDTVNYYITATDISLHSNTSRLPETGSFSFKIAQKITVAVLNYPFSYSTQPPYFFGSNQNAWSAISDILNADPQHRFQVTVLTSLKSPTALAGQDVLVLPDNTVAMDSLQTVSDWFQSGKVLLTLDSAASYAAYSGWMWPASKGGGGYTIYWSNDANLNDQAIWASDPITAGYSVGQIISSQDIGAQFYTDMLPADAHPLAGAIADPTHCYAAYRDVPSRGRIVCLGPYIKFGSDPISSDQYSMIREALIAPVQPRQLSVVAPNGGESYSSGEIVAINFSATGEWQAGDGVQLKYCNGLDTIWRQIPGAESVPYEAGSFAWDTGGLPGSHSYRVRATLTGGTVSDDSDAPFSVIPTIDIPTAKSAPDGDLIQLAGKVVTSALPGMLYVEEPDRRGGIRIISSEALTTSALVDVVGTMGTLNGERVLDAETPQPQGIGAKIGPLALRTSALGGGAFGLQQSVVEYRQVTESGQLVGRLFPAVGVNNVGLLVRVCGKVTASGQGWFYIDDGCRCNDGTGNVGVKVLCPGTTAPSTDEFVAITAVSSTYIDWDNLFRALVLPDQDSLLSISH